MWMSERGQLKRLRPTVMLFATILLVTAVVHVTLGATQAQSMWSGIYTNEQALRGEGFYGQECAECHGSALEGGEMAPALAGGEFLWNWNGLTVGDLFERIRVSMPEASPASVPRDQKADILAFLLMKNEVPAGAAELADRKEALTPIMFEAMKP